MKYNKSFLFLSLLIPQNIANEVMRKTRNTLDAGIPLQWKIIEGIENNIEDTVTIYNSLPIFSFPKYYDDCFIHTSYFSHKPNSEDINIGFVNFQYVKQLFQGIILKKHVRKWANADRNTKKTIIIYTLRSDLLSAVKQAKQCNPNITCCAIVADLPEYGDLSDNNRTLLKMYQKWSAKSARNLLKHIDCFVLLTEQMADYLKIDKPYVVMEGIATDCFGDAKDHNLDDTTKTIFYAGTLHRRFGVLTLLDAFSLIPYDNYQLIIAGIGDSEEIIKERVSKDNRIHYLGLLPREDILTIMQQATVVVNPRQNIEAFTKYSFPSKNLEYLSSGTPLVAFKLDGIPDEYDDYIKYVKGDSPIDLTRALIEVCESESKELYRRGKKARDFVINEKNAKKQTEKLLRMLAGL